MDSDGVFDIGSGPGAMSVRARSFILPQSERLVAYRTISSFSIALRMSAWDVAAGCLPRIVEGFPNFHVCSIRDSRVTES